MTMRHWMFGLCAISLVFIGCGDDSGGTEGGEKDAGPLTYGTGAAPDYAAVSEILGGPEQDGIGSCAARVCHGGDTRGQALLNFKTADHLAATLVNVKACENSDLMRVKPGDPENSWLWIKLTGEIEDVKSGKLVYEGTPSKCSGVNTGFGTRMPQAFGSFDKLSKAQLDTIYDWIKGGAPGPDGWDAGQAAMDSGTDAAQSTEDAGDDAGK